MSEFDHEESPRWLPHQAQQDPHEVFERNRGRWTNPKTSTKKRRTDQYGPLAEMKKLTISEMSRQYGKKESELIP